MDSLNNYVKLLEDIDNIITEDYSINESTKLSLEEIEEDYNYIINTDSQQLIDEGIFDVFKKLGKKIINIFKTKPQELSKQWQDKAKNVKSDLIEKIIAKLAKAGNITPDKLKEIIGKIDPTNKEQVDKLAKVVKANNSEVLADDIGTIQNAPEEELKKANITVKKKTESPEVEAVKDAFKSHKDAIVALCKDINTKPSTIAKFGLEACKQANIDVKKQVKPETVYGMCIMVLGVMYTKNLPDRINSISAYMNTIGDVLEEK